MSERDELALVLANAQRVRNGSSRLPSVDHVSRLAFDDADAILAAGYRKPRTITTAEELDALPVGSVILDPLGEAYQRIHNGDGPALWSAGDVVSTRLIILAATVLHEGDKP